MNEQLLLTGLREQSLADQLRHQLAFATAITTSLGEGVYALDRLGRCTFVNPAAEDMLGRTGADLRGQHVSEVFPIQSRSSPSIDTLPLPLLDVLRLGTVYRDEQALFMQPGGATFPTAYCAAPIITDGQVVGAVITFRDMTEVRRLEQLREEYLALISHDLRAPLTVILGHAQLLWRRLTQQGLTREAGNAQTVVECSTRMNDMIDDILDRTRADVNVRQRVAIDLVAMVQRLIEQTITPEERARITLDSVSTLRVVIEVPQIERVIGNLLSNALKFSAFDLPVTVRVFTRAADAIIAITDQGIGISAKDLAHLFEKYYRAQAAGAITGHGLGLYSSRMIVEAHGGRLWAESILANGSTFTIALPLPA